MKHITIGIIAHVDAGKTTLSEGLLFETKSIKKLGRVDNKDTLLDNDEQERDRGITIFSKQAELHFGETEVTLLDTPGHIDFAAEMERCLQVMDYAILVVSGSDGVQSHTRTLWRLLKQYNIPAFIFVNKMDQPDNNVEDILAGLKAELSDAVVCMNETIGQNKESDDFVQNMFEEIAVNSGSEEVLDTFMSEGELSDETIANLVLERRIFPCYFGSALKMQCVDKLLEGLDKFTLEKVYPDEFGARIFKITRDDKGNRLTHLKVMGGTLKVKNIVCKNNEDEDEKVNQIRVYNGASYEAYDEIKAGRVCAVVGLTNTYAGQGLGCYEKNNMELIEPVISYRITFDEKSNARQLYPKLKELEEELPELMLSWNEHDESIYIKLMGQVQIDIITNIVKNRLGVVPTFDEGRITYKETIANSVIGVGHFEPLRHYAEVHLRMEPGELGSGVEIATDCSEDILDKNWQRLIVTHLKERLFRGTAVGGVLTDVKITVINGRAHTKHTEGGDFRQATYRAVRQGLMQAENVVLEPFYNFVLDIPDNMIGRAMTDLENRFSTLEPPEMNQGRAIIKGYGPVSTLRDYQVNVNAYTSGNGSIAVSFRGYEPCHNQEEVIANSTYDPDADVRNPSASVFCAHGSGFIVPWDQVKAYMHVFDAEEKEFVEENVSVVSRESFDYSIGLDEIDQIFAKTFAANKKKDSSPYKKHHVDVSARRVGSSTTSSNYSPMSYAPGREKMMIVDGYNVIFAWDELKDIANDNINAAKDKLIFIMSNYHGTTNDKVIIVFDGYKVKENKGSDETIEDVRIIHTKEGLTADAFIERYTHEYVKQYDITVASSDGLIQTVTRGNGCRIISSRELYNKIEEVADELRKNYNL